MCSDAQSITLISSQLFFVHEHLKQPNVLFFLFVHNFCIHCVSGGYIVSTVFQKSHWGQIIRGIEFGTN